MTELWCEVLSLPEVNPSDNFFDLGGHSVLLHAVQEGLRARLGREVPLVDLFQYPTVRALAAHLAAPARPAGAAGTGPAPGGRLARVEAGRGRGTAEPFARASRHAEEDEDW
ncbi:acyl carrier protein [Streptomyces olindensis]|uniref:acyl carrier protein n=1 Tax=Streptomyces olindensis TaxID=358823 RepID=UPI0036840812